MKKILVVDDDNVLRTVIRRYLEKQGYQVEDAGSGSDGLAAFNDNAPRSDCFRCSNAGNERF